MFRQGEVKRRVGSYPPYAAYAETPSVQDATTEPSRSSILNWASLTKSFFFCEKV